MNDEAPVPSRSVTPATQNGDQGQTMYVLYAVCQLELAVTKLHQ